MTVFDVLLNDRKLCRAGVGSDGVLNAIVSWVKLIGPAARQAREHKTPIEETRLHVGGLRGGMHRSWSQVRLSQGDRILIVIADARRWDKPAALEPQGRKPQGRPTSRGSQTRFLNVDLDIHDTTPIDDLVNAFGRRTVQLFVGREGRRYSAHLELGRTMTTADRTIRRFVELVKQLPPAAKRRWNRAKGREFNVGVQAEARPHAEIFPLEAETIRAAASVNARIGFTIYGVQVRPSPATPAARRTRAAPTGGRRQTRR